MGFFFPIHLRQVKISIFGVDPLEKIDWRGKKYFYFASFFYFYQLFQAIVHCAEFLVTFICKKNVVSKKTFIFMTGCYSQN